ncbi:MAG: hypothetical protein ACI9ZT_001240 [Gammaproteobacteria bacterium]|jgi:hypothetical protein
MFKHHMNRRQFLKHSSTIVFGTTIITSGGASIFSPLSVFAENLAVLDEYHAKILLSLIRQMYPHEMLADTHYSDIIKGLDAEANKDDDVRHLLNDGIAHVETISFGKWLEISPSMQSKLMGEIADSPFFAKLKSTIIVTLYNDPAVWKQFGYEGEAFSKGGYLHRGFNDLDWLPDPPLDASPKS